MKYKQPEEFFKYIIEKGNINIINDAQKCLAMALDLLDNEKTNFKLLKIAINNNVYKELLKAYNSDSNAKTHCINKAIKILTEDCCLENEKALNAVGWLASNIYFNEWVNFTNQKNKPVSNSNNEQNNEIEQIFSNITEERSLQASERSKAIQTNNILDKKNWTLEDIGLEMVYCPAGEFMMGSPAPVTDKKNYKGIFTDEIINGELGRNIDEIQHKVIISKPFFIGKFPVTEGQYFNVTGNRTSFYIDYKKPIVDISWSEAKEFCTRLNFLFKDKLPENYSFSLPTEAQWEYACRAGTTTSLNSGKNITSYSDICENLDEVGWYKENSGGQIHQVGQKEPNAWGIYDMHGNVWEWCKDLYGEYASSAKTETVDATSGRFPVFRGGSWFSKPWNCRSAYRCYYSPEYEYLYGRFSIRRDHYDRNPRINKLNPPVNSSKLIGFRVALVPIK